MRAKACVLRLVVILVALILSGCGPSTAVEGAELVQSERHRVTSPDVEQTELAQLVGGNSDFAFALYRLPSKEKGNLFYSPCSISLALAMTYAGARGETEHRMADTLRFTLPPARLHPAFNALDLELAGRGEGAKGKDEKGFRLSIVNAVWGAGGPQVSSRIPRPLGRELWRWD